MNDIAARQSGLAVFSPRARLLKLIGAELISDEVVAITELAKNAHDADASLISIQFVGVTRDDGEIYIRDDGHGMDLDTLLTRWMQPAGSAKGREGSRYTEKGRRMLGEKGVGRFAADKLAATLELVSRGPGDSRELHAVFNWDDFASDDRLLAEVRSRWEMRPAEWLESHGTVLRMAGLRTRWNERLFRRLCTRLSRLVSPFNGPSGFRIQIESDEFPQYAGEIGGFLDGAPYRLEAEFDGHNRIGVRLNGGKTDRITWTDAEPLTCGPVRVRLFAFDLEVESLARIGPRTEVRAWLREWSGVSVYRDGFRVWPYGEPHDDWLRLDQRRVNNPVVRLSNNQVVGFIEIGGDRNPDLRDQTNREGLIHNEAFGNLQRFILLGLQLLEAERQSVRHPAGRRRSPGGPSGAGPNNRSLPDLLESLAGQSAGSVAAELRRAATRARVELSSREVTQKRMLDGYSDLAAAGHASSLLGRGVAAAVNRLRSICEVLRGSLRDQDLSAIVTQQVALHDIEGLLSSASDQLTALAQAGGTASRRRRGIDVVAELKRLHDALSSLLLSSGARLEIAVEPGVLPRTEMRPEMFSAVISALVSNSIGWASNRPLRMMASISTDDESVQIIFSDNGKGVLAPLQDTLFEPMVSGRDGAAGMGLALARHIVTAHGGSIALIVDRRRKGAAFTIALPRKRPRATTARD